MKSLTTLVLALSLTTMTACKSNSSSSTNEMEADTQSPSVTMFDQLVNDIFAQTSDTDKPVNTNKLSIELNHDEANFDHLF